MSDKEIHIVYYGTNGAKAKERAVAIRADRKKAYVRHAEAFDGTAEPSSEVTILPCVSGHDAGRIRAAYGDKVKSAALPPIPPAKAPPIVPEQPTEPVELPPPPVPTRKAR